MRLIDSHAHLQAERFAHDAHEVAADARSAGVERLLVPGWDATASRRSIEMAESTGWTDASAGVHPHDAAGVDDPAWTEVTELARHPRVVAIGETGLDYDRMISPRDVQLENLRRHFALALETGKPLILHCRSAKYERDAQDDLIAELRSAAVGGGDWRTRYGTQPPAVLHSFSGPVDYAEHALDLGLAISFSGLVFRRREEPSAEVARLVPDDGVLVETDSPYLPPPGANRRRNEPRWVEVTARWLAEQRGVEPDVLGERLVANYDRVFGTPRR